MPMIVRAQHAIRIHPVVLGQHIAPRTLTLPAFLLRGETSMLVPRRVTVAAQGFAIAIQTIPIQRLIVGSRLIRHGETP